MNEKWKRVNKNLPCPICRHTDWCMVSSDGTAAICQRVESDRPTKNSGGWIHRLGTAPRVGCPAPTARREAPAIDIGAYFAALPTTQQNLQVRLCEYLERELGLPAEILRALDWRWDRSAKAVAIPMRNARGEVTGIRYRALKTGAKWAKRGSKDGLFFAHPVAPGTPSDELIVCEGPTDCAAAMACGFWCVGRSSCGTGRDAIRELIALHRVRRVTIVADDDKPKPRPGGGTWQPGLDGARRLAEQLGVAHRIVLPPPGFKDLRDWYRAGTLNATSFRAMIQGTGFSA